MENLDMKKIERGRLVGKIYSYIGKAFMVASIPFFIYGCNYITKISKEQIKDDYKGNLVDVINQAVDLRTKFAESDSVCEDVDGNVILYLKNKKIGELDMDKKDVMKIIENYDKYVGNNDNFKKFWRSYLVSFLLSSLGGAFCGVGYRKKIYGRYWGT